MTKALVVVCVHRVYGYGLRFLLFQNESGVGHHGK
jgi:hypothetical protein